MKRLSIILLLISSFSLSIFAHEGHIHKAPWEACEKKQKEDNCSYVNGDNDLFRGSCQYFSNKLMCVRNKPIIKATNTVTKNF